ncbi:TRAP transporter large permease [Leucobacter albus]|uniref:TRAP transporter large permease n=1 Tax=Leucobacter albus TaxID=272210 RepID=A0ABW3TPG6_9MICO
MSAIVMVLVLLALLILRVPVAISLLVPSLLYLTFDDTANLNIAIQQLMSGVNTFPLLAVPMFILLGNLANAGGFTDRIFDVANATLGRLRGGLGYVNVATSFGFSWISGAAIADAATMGKVVVPQMIKRGYPVGFSLGLTGVSSLIAPMVPPSIPAVVYAVTAGVSISTLFIAGIIPALLLTLLLLIYVFIIARRTKLDEGARADSAGPSLLRQIVRVLPVFGAPVVILGGILGGIFTPTEASAAGVFYTLLLGAIYRSFTREKLKDAFVGTTATSASIMFIVVAAALFGWILARERVPQVLASNILSVTENPFVFMLLLLVLLLLVGALLEPVSAILIMVPVLAPLAPIFGIDPVHMGVVVIFALMIGLLTPPVGLVLFVMSSVTGYSVGTVLKGSLPFYSVMLAVLVTVAFVPLLIPIPGLS